MKRVNKAYLILSLLLLVIGHWTLVIRPVSAFEFRSSSYIIDWGNFNITSGKKTSTNYNLTDTVGQNAPGQYDSTGYVVKSGFQYIYDLQAPFSFIVDNLAIDFGTLIPGVAATGTTNLIVATPSGHGYQVMALENHPLQINSANSIPDVLGDNNTASESVSDFWTQVTTYGFGFNAQGDGTASFFPGSTYYRQFANTAVSETAQVLMSENTPGKDRTAHITFKALISSTQAAGNYENAITFIAVPKY